MLITDPSVFHNVEIVRSTFKNTNQYRNWLIRTKHVYENLIKEHTWLDYRPYQYETAALYCCKRFNVCSLSMGLGKTIISAIVLLSIYQSFDNRRGGSVHITVPSIISGKSRWLVDFSLFKEFDGNVAFMESSSDLSNEDKCNKPIWVYTHDFLKRKYNDTKLINDVIIKRFKPNYLIVDEVHNLKRGSKRTAQLFKLRKHSKNVLSLSGTISDGRLNAIQTVFDFTYSYRWDYFGQNFPGFFGTKREITTNYIFGEDNIEAQPQRYLDKISLGKMSDWYELSSRFLHRLCASSPNVKDCITLPSVNVIEVPVQPYKNHVDLYLKCLHNTRKTLENILEYGGTNSAFRAKAFSLMQPLLDASNTPDLETTKKFEELENICENTFQQNEKTIIICNSVKAAFKISSFLKQKYTEDKVVRLYGTDENESPKLQSNDARQDAAETFQFNPNIRFAVMSINLIAESIDLTAASNIIYYDYSWQSLKVLQSKARVVRSGNKAPKVNIYFLFNKGMIDTHQYSLLNLKEEASKQLVDFDFGIQNTIVNAETLITNILHPDNSL